MSHPASAPSPPEPLVLRPSWPAPARVGACVTLRPGGVSGGAYASLNLAAHVGDAVAAVAENRRRLAAALRLPAPPNWLRQVHGATVLELDVERAPAEASGLGPAPGAADGPGGADGAVTSVAGVVCAVLTADCLPVLLADRAGRRVGVAHAGWRGLAAGVLPAAVAALGSPPEDVLAWLGPGIGAAAFEVGDEVRRAFDAAGFDTAAAFAANAHGRWQADLYTLAAQSLRAAGVGAVFGGGFCTFREADRFFSHRREAPCGRMATLIWLEGDQRPTDRPRRPRNG